MGPTLANTISYLKVTSSRISLARLTILFCLICILYMYSIGLFLSSTMYNLCKPLLFQSCAIMRLNLFVYLTVINKIIITKKTTNSLPDE